MRVIRLVLAALAGMALLVPSPSWAEHDSTCHPDDEEPGESAVWGIIGMLEVLDTASGGGPAKLRLETQVKKDGSVQVAGVVQHRVPGDTRVNVLTAGPGAGGAATCADADRDGEAGLTQLVAPFSPTGQTREHVFLAFAPIGGDIDESGVYQLSVTIGERTFLVDVEARVLAPNIEITRDPG